MSFLNCFYKNIYFYIFNYLQDEDLLSLLKVCSKLNIVVKSFVSSRIISSKKDVQEFFEKSKFLSLKDYIFTSNFSYCCLSNNKRFLKIFGKNNIPDFVLKDCLTLSIKKNCVNSVDFIINNLKFFNKFCLKNVCSEEMYYFLKKKYPLIEISVSPLILVESLKEKISKKKKGDSLEDLLEELKLNISVDIFPLFLYFILINVAENKNIDILEFLELLKEKISDKLYLKSKITIFQRCFDENNLVLIKQFFKEERKLFFKEFEERFSEIKILDLETLEFLFQTRYEYLIENPNAPICSFSLKKSAVKSDISCFEFIFEKEKEFKISISKKSLFESACFKENIPLMKLILRKVSLKNLELDLPLLISNLGLSLKKKSINFIFELEEIVSLCSFEKQILNEKMFLGYCKYCSLEEINDIINNYTFNNIDDILYILTLFNHFKQLEILLKKFFISKTCFLNLVRTSIKFLNKESLEILLKKEINFLPYYNEKEEKFLLKRVKIFNKRKEKKEKIEELRVLMNKFANFSLRF